VAVCCCYAEGGITTAHCHWSTNFSNGPCKFIVSYVSGNEKQVYEFVVRHFLACCSKDAEGLETVVDIDITGEKVKYYLVTD
jgi:DNA topoisomerase IA